jgi:hypothetical protein
VWVYSVPCVLKYLDVCVILFERLELTSSKLLYRLEKSNWVIRDIGSTVDVQRAVLGVCLFCYFGVVVT